MTFPPAPPSSFRVLLTDRIDPVAEAILADHAEIVFAPDNAPETLYRLAAEVDGIIVRCKLPDDICIRAPRLRGLVRHGVGLDFIPVEAATRAGVAVANLPGSNTNAVAEYCLSAILHLRRPLARIDAVMRSAGWEAARGPAYGLEEVAGSTLAIIGVGAIGTRIGQMASQGLGMKVLGIARSERPLPDGFERSGIDEALARADVVVLTCSLTPETMRLVDARRVGLMKRGAMLINVSRGPVIELAPVLEALRDGRLGGAALDVHETHPVEMTDELRQCPNLLLTPHIAGITQSSARAMGVGSVEQMLSILAGQEPSNLVNPEYRAHRRVAG